MGIIVVSREPLESAVFTECEWFDEASDVWPFSLSDFEDCSCAPGWLFQQMLKLYAPSVIPDIAEDVLLCDADVLWLGGGGDLSTMGADDIDAGLVTFLASDASDESRKAFHCTFDSERCPPIRSSVDLSRYDDFVPAMLPGLKKPRPGKQTAVCHHALLQCDIVAALRKEVEAYHGKSFWTVFRDVARDCCGRASEYELYHAFAVQYFPLRVSVRQLAFGIAADATAFVASRRGDDKALAFVVSHSHLHGLSPEELRDREGVINGNVEKEVARRLGQGRAPELSALLAGSGMF